jgi:hypothetical protein
MAKKVTKKVRGSVAAKKKVQSVKSAGSAKKKVAKKVTKKTAKKVTKKVAKKTAKKVTKKVTARNPVNPDKSPRMVAKKTGKKVAKKVRTPKAQKNLENWRDAQAKANRAMRKAPKSIANRVATRGTSQPAKTKQPKTKVGQARPSTPARVQPPRVEKFMGSAERVEPRRLALEAPKGMNASRFASWARGLGIPAAVAGTAYLVYQDLQQGNPIEDRGGALGVGGYEISRQADRVQRKASLSNYDDLRPLEVIPMQPPRPRPVAFVDESALQRERMAESASAMAERLAAARAERMATQPEPMQNVLRDRYGNPVTSSDGSVVRTMDYDNMTQEEIDALFD